MKAGKEARGEDWEGKGQWEEKGKSGGGSKQRQRKRLNSVVNSSRHPKWTSASKKVNK